MMHRRVYRGLLILSKVRNEGDLRFSVISVISVYACIFEFNRSYLDRKIENQWNQWINFFIIHNKKKTS